MNCKKYILICYVCLNVSSCKCLCHCFMINCPIKQRMDLGECPKIHDLALRADYEQASKRKDYYYDIDVS